MNNIHVCEGFFQRLFGLIFKDDEQILIFPRCNSIHTFFMNRPIDVYMVTMRKEIIHYYPKLKRNRIILPKKDVFFTIEGPIGFDIDYVIDNFI